MGGIIGGNLNLDDLFTLEKSLFTSVKAVLGPPTSQTGGIYSKPVSWTKNWSRNKPREQLSASFSCLSSLAT